MDFRGKVAVVTGAGRGIGRSVAIAYAQQGANVVACDCNVGLLQQTGEQIRLLGQEALLVDVDVRVPGDIVRLMDTAADKYGKIDILVNNAGVSKWKSLYELTVEEWDDILATNLRSVFLCSREAARHMRRQKSGAIVNIASTRAIMSEPDSEAYAASKGGILALTHAMAVSLGTDGIRVNAISPGWIETGEYERLRDIDHQQHPAGRVGRPEDIAQACLFLTRPDSDFITGANLVVDGGMTRKMIYEP